MKNLYFVERLKYVKALPEQCLAGHWIVIVAPAALHRILPKTMFADFIRILLCCISFFATEKERKCSNPIFMYVCVKMKI